MKVKDVDLQIIQELLQSVPEGMEIESIVLTSGYSLRLIAGTQEIYDRNYEEALSQLFDILHNYDVPELTNSSKQKFFAQK